MSKIDNDKLKLYNTYFDISYYNQPYENDAEYLEDLRCLVDLYVNSLFIIRKSNFKENTSYLGLRGIVITDSEVNNAMRSSALDNKNNQVDEGIKQSIITSIAHINNRTDLSKIEVKLEKFFVKHKCNFLTRLAMVFSLVSEMDRKYERLFGYLQDDNTIKKPTLGLVYTCALLTQNVTLAQALELLDNKVTTLIFDDINSYTLPCFLSKGLKMRKFPVDFFTNNQFESFGQNTLCETFTSTDQVDDIIINIDLQEKLVLETKKILDNKLKKSIVHLYGPPGSGKRLHVKHIAKRLNKTVMFVNLKYVALFDSQILSLLSNVYISAFLNDGLICFYNCDFEVDFQSNLEFILHDVFRYSDMVFLLNENPKYFENCLQDFLPTVDIKFDYPDASESVKIWQYYSNNYNLGDEGIKFHQISNKFKYTAGQIKDILLKAYIESSENNDSISEEILIKNCREYAVHNLDKRAALINSNFTFDDLVLDDDQKNILMSACNYIKFKDIVYEDWGFKSKVPYGKGLSVLLYGPPGTGKTMGAQVIANELGLQLYKIDLSQIMNKYIGETEKNLSDIFSEAKKSNAILLFDEADSLFGKRTDVKDSNDKSANNETSFLLQKMEEYDGVSILTTNKFNNFDEAFRRRIRFIVSFPMPDVNMRRELWKKVFPKQAPLSSDFDDWFLAENFELSGSNIKSIAILASYLAVAEKSNIMMKHILLALKYESQKSGKIISKQDLGVYGDQI